MRSFFLCKIMCLICSSNPWESPTINWIITNQDFTNHFWLTYSWKKSMMLWRSRSSLYFGMVFTRASLMASFTYKWNEITGADVTILSLLSWSATLRRLGEYNLHNQRPKEVLESTGISLLLAVGWKGKWDHGKALWKAGWSLPPQGT